MNDPTINALIRLLTIQQVQIVALERLVTRRQPALPVPPEIATKVFNQTEKQVGERIDRAVRDTYRTLMLNQEMDAAGFLDLWALRPDEGPSAGGEAHTPS